MTTPNQTRTRDPLTPLDLDRNERDRLRRAVRRAVKHCPHGMSILVTADGFTVLDRSEQVVSRDEVAQAIRVLQVAHSDGVA